MQSSIRRGAIPAILGLLGVLGSIAVVMARDEGEPASIPASDRHRSPVALAISSDGKRLLAANQTANSVSLVDTESLKVLHEIESGEKPAGIAIHKDGQRAVVTHWYGYDLAVLGIKNDRLSVLARVEVGPEPRGVVLSSDGKTAYVAVGASNEVVRVDLDAARVTGRVEVGREPRGLAISPADDRLLVGNARGGSLTVISTPNLEVERTIPIDGVNLRQVAIDSEGVYGYVANMRNRGMATTDRNIDLGWVLGQRLTRIPLDGSEEYSTQSLDAQGKAAGDAHGLALSPDGTFIAVSCGGTHEVMIFRTDLGRLPWRIGGSRDLIHYSLLNGDGRFRRVTTGGRPTELAFAPDGKTLYVANFLGDSIQVINAETAELTGEVDLGRPREVSLARQGEAIFHDALRSFNQWYSCNTCHSDGHLNGDSFDTMNDGWHDYSTTPEFSRKQVPTLRGVTRTGPWTWHGWQTSIEDAMVESFTKSMQGPRPSDNDVKAIIAYLDTLEHPRNPFRGPNGELSEAAQRGEAVYRSPKAACADCHGGPEFTDGKVHTIGLEDRRDVYKGYNPPSLRGLYDSDPYLHDGRAKTLRETLTGDHSPDMVTGLGDLTEQELSDLLEYLKTL